MFEKILGHETQKQILIRDILDNTVSHAYAFSGVKGIGKMTFAEEFVKILLKTEKLESSPDYVCVSKTEHKKDIIVSQIREEIVDKVYIAPAVGDYKVYIIDGADSLNDQAQNSLLKTLEEPPSFVVVILIVENMEALLPTIVSRVREIRFNKMSNDIIEKYLKDRYPDKILTREMLEYVDGSLGKACDLMPDNNMLIFGQVLELVKAVENKDVLEALRQFEKLSLKNSNILNYLEYIVYSKGYVQMMKYIEDSRIRFEQNGNEEIIKSMLAINLCK